MATKKINRKPPPIVKLKYRKGELIIKEGDYGISIYKIVTGKVQILTHSADMEIALALLGPGEIFGEMAFLSKDTEVRSASAKAEQDSELEVWHPDYFRAICPGKDKVQGRDNWIRGLEWAVEVFGKGKVCTFFVPGMEPIEFTLEGMEYCASIGVQPMGVIWAVSSGSKFRRHRTPVLDWWLELNEKCTDLWFKYGFVERELLDNAANVNVCIDCNFTTVVSNLIDKRKLEEDPNWIYPLRPPLKEIATTL